MFRNVPGGRREWLRHPDDNPEGFMEKQKQRLTDAEARRLLERASELDAEQANTIDIATVREIATEAGISSTAVDAALREKEMGGRPLDTSRNQRGLRVASRVAMTVAAAYVVLAIISRMIF